MRAPGPFGAFGMHRHLCDGTLPWGAAPTTLAAGYPAVHDADRLDRRRRGEPGIDNDKAGNVYVVGPQGIPSVVNGTSGVGFWVSHDNADTFTNAAFLGSFLGGGDSDVAVAPDDAAVWLADLEAITGGMPHQPRQGRHVQAGSVLSPIRPPARRSAPAGPDRRTTGNG